jgi:hypothetical protein
MDRDLKRAKMLISLVHDGQLTDEESRFLEKAVLRYPELKLEIYRHERLHDIMGMVPNASAPADIEDRVFHAIRSEGPAKRMARIIFFPVRRFPVEATGAIAASVIIFFVALISFPSSVGTDRESAVLPHDAVGTSTASVVMGEESPAVTGKTHAPAEDVALIPRAPEDKLDDRFGLGTTDEKLPAAPEIDKKTFSSELSPAGVVTAAGVSAEKVSKIFVPTHDAPYSSAKSEAPVKPNESIGSIVSTTYISSPSEEPGLPATLLIRTNDPANTQKDIMDKAVALGGTVTIRETEESKGKDTVTTGPEMGYRGEDPEGNMVSLPPEKIDELLDYLAARYPETDKEIKNLKAKKTTLFLRIDVTPTTNQ